MTRGRFLIVVNDENDKPVVYVSTEFNGDMYIEEGSCGEDAAQTFTKANITSIEDFKKYVADFNRRNYEYEEEELVWLANPDEDSFSFSNVTDIFDITSWSYHSDYMFVRNLIDDTIEMKADNGVVHIESGDGAVFNYDEFYDMRDGTYDSEWGAYLVTSTSDVLVYVDDVYHLELMEKYNLTEEEAWELINNHMEHPHDIITIYESVEDVAEDYINQQDVNDFLSDYIDRTRLGEDLVKDEGYYKFDCSERVMYYMP